MRAFWGYVRGLVPVRRDERGLALFLFAYLAGMVLSDWIGKIGADSLFVKRFGVEYIPAMYVATPLAMLATSAVVFALVDRIRRRALLFGFTAFVLVASLAIQLAIPLGGLVFPVAYVFAHGVKETIYLLFWIYAGDLYDAEQAKRLFPFFAGAMLVGKLIGSTLSVPLAETIHAENFIGSQAVGFGACLLLIAGYWKHLPEGRSRPVTDAYGLGVVASIRRSLVDHRTLTADPLLRTFAIGVFLWYFLMQIGSYLYLVGLDTASASSVGEAGEDLFSQMYAAVYTSGTLAAIGIQVLFTAGGIRRLGVGWMLMVFPLWYLLSYGSALIAFTLITAIAIQLGERVIVPAIHRPASELVYNQVPEHVRARARALLSGGVNALGNIAAAGLLIGAAALGAAATGILAVATLFSLAFVANGFALRGALGRRVGQNLVSDDEALRREALQMLSSDGRAVPVDALRAALHLAEGGAAESIRFALGGRGLPPSTETR